MKKNKELLFKIQNIIEPLKGEILEFVIDKKEFGNMSITIKVNKKTYHYTSDRGEVLCENKTIFPAYYREINLIDVNDKILEAIKRTLVIKN
jgi:hypothetical protein